MNNNTNNEPKDGTILPEELQLPGLDGVACGSTRAVPLPHPHTYGKLVQAVTGTFSTDNPLICAPFPCSQSKMYCHCCLLAGKGASGYTVSTYSQNHGSKCRHYSQFMEWYCNYLVCNKLKPPSESAIPVDYKYLLALAAVHPVNLPAARTKPSAIVTEAAGDEASSPSGSNSRAQAVGGGGKSDGVLSGSPKNMGKYLSAHFLSQLSTRVGLYVGELVKDEFNKITVDNSDEDNPEASDDEVATANPPADEHEFNSEPVLELNGIGNGSGSGSDSNSGSQSDSDSEDIIIDDVVEDASPKRMTTRSRK